MTRQFGRLITAERKLYRKCIVKETPDLDLDDEKNKVFTQVNEKAAETGESEHYRLKLLEKKQEDGGDDQD